MQIQVGSSQAIGASDAVAEIRVQISGAPQVLFVSCPVQRQPAELLRCFSTLFPDCRVHGVTSCVGVMTPTGFLDEQEVGALALYDADGSIGVGHASLNTNARACAHAALELALADADELGAIPSLVWVTATPGIEEEVIAGIEEVLGTGVPIVGGSAADNEVAGKWKLFFRGGPTQAVLDQGVVITVLYPEGRIGTAFHSGYQATSHRGIVTASMGRVVQTIDGEPAADVYRRWSEGALTQVLNQPGNILANTTLLPFGRKVGDRGSVESWQLAHPDALLEDGALSLFAEVSVGDELVLMRGTPDSLATRAGRVAQAAMLAGGISIDDVAGALVIYCAGCMLTIQDRMDEVVVGLDEALGQAPFLGQFTFGEQGCFLGGENRHGNLMISVLVFAK